MRTRDLLKVLPALNIKPVDLPRFLNDYTYDDTESIAQALIDQHLPYWVDIDKFSDAVLSELETNYVFNNRTKRPFKPNDLKWINWDIWNNSARKLLSKQIHTANKI